MAAACGIDGIVKVRPFIHSNPSLLPCTSILANPRLTVQDYPNIPFPPTLDAPLARPRTLINHRRSLKNDSEL